MKAIVMSDYGNANVLQEREVTRPTPQDHQAIVELQVTTVNSGDQLIRSGAFQEFLPLRFPHILGVEIGGVVKKIGKSVTKVKPGDRVIGLTLSGGGYADYAAVDENLLAVIPETLSLEETVALSGVGLTAWQALFRYGQLQVGQRILIHAGAGAVGHLAVQLAKQHGAYIIATARTENLEFVRQLGADEVVDYGTTDFSEVIQPVDLVLDMVRDGGITDEKSYSVLKNGGKYLSLVSPAVLQNPIVRGIENLFVQVDPHPSDWLSLIRYVQEHKLKIYVERVFPFSYEGVVEAHQINEIGGKKGQLLISWNRKNPI
ncbi:NADP-dependent oxidoreductase [Paenibacillus sp. ISL-20]|uniref:NADP-dependent oxidoreductase n=1 Tax=Paenibacillus sp. ISL-20 TaxID=2819163 RepID=UPI001BEC5953|nr:NADP-dependent oxidoreductase [Paenibacillus sp. ISL-20]MBT2761258.1 NADP-dependent oxidoreductase [Paenibacillus sp. ISL-20]